MFMITRAQDKKKLDWQKLNCFVAKGITVQSKEEVGILLKCLALGGTQQGWEGAAGYLLLKLIPKGETVMSLRDPEGNNYLHHLLRYLSDVIDVVTL